MIRRRSGRRLATALFLDIVDSTRIATELGDRRWRELLGAFRRMVRAELRRHGGREEDTAGDGFFATFSEPAAGVQAAAAIVAGAQRLGLDVRCGLHSGELERIDSRLGGIAAHIAARVMATAGSAQIVVTGTVRDLVTGGGFEFAAAGDTELKGVPGRWMLYRLTLVDGVALPAPLEPDSAADLRRRDQPTAALGVQRLGGALVAVAVVAGLVFVLVLRPPGDTSAPSGAPSASASGQLPITMFRIDPDGHQIVREVRDEYLSLGRPDRVWTVDGVLWQDTLDSLVRRDIETGEALDAIDHPDGWVWTMFGFGSVWFVVDEVPGSPFFRVALHRVNPTSGLTLGTIEVGRVQDIAIARDAFFVLRPDGLVSEVDPRANAIVDKDMIPFESGQPGPISSIGGRVWICECAAGRRITHWDPDADEVIRRVEFPQGGFILGDSRESSQGPISIDTGTVWLFDADARTLTPVNVTTGDAGQSVGAPAEVRFSEFGLDSIWMTSDAGVFRVPLDTLSLQTILPPDGALPGGIGVDEATGAVWVATW